MPSRRQVLAAGVATLGLAPVVIWLSSPARMNAPMPNIHTPSFPVAKPDADWRSALSPEAYYVLRSHGTERAFTSPLNAEKRHGTFVCAGCDNPLYSSETKFESGTGWPSFSDAIAGGVETTIDRSYFMVRTEVHCARCGGHLGHVFDDGPRPTGLRHCINGAALEFQEG